jgi:helicase
MRVVEVLEDSFFSVNSLGGKLVYMEGGRYPQERELLPSEEVDPKIPYPLLNPLQTAFELFYEGGNVVVAAPTSAGKSLLAYLFMRRHKGKVVYCAPTKALVGEKRAELRNYYKRVGMRTGDNILENLQRDDYDAIVAVYESLAQGFRNSVDWVKDIACVVLDEVHQIRSKWVVEEVIAYLKSEGVPILALSATLPQEDELARYISARLLIRSRWRPVPLERRPYSLNEIVREKGLSEEEKVFQAIYTLSSQEEQTIIFVPSKKLGWELLELAHNSKVGILNETVPFDMEETEEREPEIAFHNADVPKEEREKIEKAFREGKINKLIATQTLAYGVNLPADKVIIFAKVYPSGELRPGELDIIQMEGRAGRLGIKDKGVSCIVAFGRKEEVVRERIAKAQSDVFKTALEEELSKDALSLLLLLGIKRHNLAYDKFLQNLYSYRKMKKNTIKDVLKFLEENGYVFLGKVSQKGNFCIHSGISPMRFEEFLRRLSLSMDKIVIVRPLISKKLDTFAYFIKEDKLEANHRSKVLSMLGGRDFGDNTFWLVFYTQGYAIEYPRIERPPGEFSTLRTEALHLFRTLYELKRLKFISWSLTELLQITHAIAYGVPPEYSSLAGIKGIGHIYANYLWRAFHEQDLTKKIPPLLSPTKELIDALSGYEKEISGKLEEKIEERYRAKGKANAKHLAQQKVKQIKSLIQRQANGHLIDDHILTIASYCISNQLLPKKKAIELLRAKLEEEGEKIPF